MAITKNVGMPVTPYPIENFGDLKQAVQLWADRDDDEFVNQIPNFVAFAQKEILRTIRWNPFFKQAYLRVINGNAPIPNDYIEGMYMFFSDKLLTFRETSMNEVAYTRAKNPFATLDTVKEVIFARVGLFFDFFPAFEAETPDEAGEDSKNQLVVGYYADQPLLKSDSDTSPLITIAPELLLYGALKHAMVFLRDTDGEQVWKERQEAVAKELEYQNKRGDFSIGSMAVKQPSFQGW